MYNTAKTNNKKIWLKTIIFFSRHEAASHPDLGVQLDVFEEQRESDEAQGPGGINLNSHLDVFYAILKQVNIFHQR